MKQLALDRRHFPLVLMLEPLFRCNLKCKGCGKINQPDPVLRRQLSADECIEAAEECGAPVVSIPGGEPLLHPDIHLIVDELIKRRRFVYLCTNSLLLPKKIDNFSPSPYLTFNIHLDGLKEEHDEAVGRNGVFDHAVKMIRMLVSRGFRVTTNTTFFGNATPAKTVQFFDFLKSLSIEGMTVSSAFNYEKAADQTNFLGRQRTQQLFKSIFESHYHRGWHFNHSFLYLDFLVGNQPYNCSPWGNPTRNIFGWQRPCYLLEDGYVSSYRELIETTPWERYGAGRDPRCTDCMVHCGYEPTAVMDTIKNPWKPLLAYHRQRKKRKR